MHVHFICAGNVYRSRLAEAHCNSRASKSIHATSSGTEATANTCGPICWYAQRLLEQSLLISHMSLTWKQSTPDMISDNDLVIFMTNEEYEYARTRIVFNGNKYEIWDIPDLSEIQSLAIEETINLVEESQKKF